LIERGHAEASEGQPLLEAHRRPRARTEVGTAAVGAGIACAIDVSDGLLQDLDHIAEQSEVGIEVDCAAIPLHPAARALLEDSDALDLALGGGEDFELVLVAPEATLAILGGDITLIGRVVAEHAGEAIALDAEGTRYEPTRRGWDQLASTGAETSS
jgi:thiamine-monophosphate kinase